MAVTSKLHLEGSRLRASGDIDWVNDTIKVMLLDNTLAPNQDTHEFIDDVNANEVSGAGYTAGGATLGTKSVTSDAGTNEIRLNAADVEWANSTITAARYAIVYKDTGVAGTSPIVSSVDFDADQSSVAAAFKIQWANGRVAVGTLA